MKSIRLDVVETTSGPLKVILIPFVEFKKILLYHQTFKDYQRLTKDYEALKARLVGMEEVAIENKRYEKLLDFKRNLVFSSIVAGVIGRDPTNWNAAIIIDKGEVDGISIGMPVVNPLGVVGKVAEVTKRTSKVILLTDPSFSVAAIIQRSREGGLVSGTLQENCRMRYLAPDADIKKGDVVVTSRLSSSFPEGLLIGEVIGVEESKSAPGVEGVIASAVLTSQLEEVIVIKK